MPGCPRFHQYAASACAVLWLAVLMGAPMVHAATAGDAGASPAWSVLSPAQQQALKPLQNDWHTIDPQRRQKWIEIASRFDRMTPDERTRVQQRMNDWVHLSPQQRNEARQSFQEAKALSPQDREARWEAYKALPEDQRRGLADRAVQSNQTAAAVRPLSRASANQQIDAKAQGKLNTVPPANAASAKPKAIAPALVQSRPGATTNSLTARPMQPPHQQAGLPKVATTPDFVDARTLLPQRGPQGTAAGPRKP